MIHSQCNMLSKDSKRVLYTYPSRSISSLLWAETKFSLKKCICSVGSCSPGWASKFSNGKIQNFSYWKVSILFLFFVSWRIIPQTNNHFRDQTVLWGELVIPSQCLLLLHSGMPPFHSLISGWWGIELDDFVPTVKAVAHFGVRLSLVLPALTTDWHEASIGPWPCSNMGTKFGFWAMDLSLSLCDLQQIPLYRCGVWVGENQHQSREKPYSSLQLFSETYIYGDRSNW